MIQRPPGVGAFEFVIMSTLRAAQLMKGCRPRIDGLHKATVMAQHEVAEGKVGRLSASADFRETAAEHGPVVETVATYESVVEGDLTVVGQV